MRALLIPQVVTGELTAEGSFNTYRQVIEMLSRREPSFFYLWARHRDASLPRLWPNVEVFAEGVESQTFYQQMVAVTGRLFEMFNRVSGPYPIDAVFTSRAGAAPALMLGLATAADAPVPCVLLEPRVYSPGSVSHNLVTELDAGARALGYATALCAYWSEWERDEALKCVEMWLSPAALKQAESNAFVVPYVVDVPDNMVELREKARSVARLNEQSASPREYSRKRLVFSGRLNVNKRFPQVLQAYAKVLQSRSDVEVWVHAGTGAFSKLEALKGRRWHRWHRTSERLPLREDYHKLLAGSHVAAYASMDEGVNATVLEMVAAGIAMALPRRPWVEKLFSPLEYPYAYGRLGELPALLDWLLDHEDEARQRLAPIREAILVKHGQAAWEKGWGRVFAAVQEWNDRNKVVPLRRFREDVDTLLAKDGTGLSFATALEATGATKVFRRGAYRPGLRRVLSTYGAYVAVRQYDDYTSAQPRLVNASIQ